MLAFFHPFSHSKSIGNTLGNVFDKMEETNMGGGAESSSPLRFTDDEFEPPKKKKKIGFPVIFPEE